MLRGLGGFCMNFFGNLLPLTSHLKKTCIHMDPAGARQAYRLVSGEFLPGLGPGQAGFYGGHPHWFFRLDFECHGPMDKMYPPTTKPVFNPHFFRWMKCNSS